MANINLSVIRSEVKSALHAPTLSTSRIDLWANLGQDAVVREMDPDWMTVPFTFTTVSGEYDYFIPDILLNKVVCLKDITNDVLLQSMEQADIDAIDPARDETGTPLGYTFTGMSGVKDQPSSASVISIVSSSAADTSQTVRVYGVVGGIRRNESKTLVGTTRQDMSLSFTSVEKVVLSGTCAGNITITSNETTTPVTLAVIPPGQLSQSYHPISIYPIPDGAYSMAGRGIIGPKPMVNAEDRPDVPEGWEDAVLIWTKVLAHEDQYEFDRADVLRAQFYQLVMSLKKEQGNTRNSRIKIKTRTKSRGSRFALPDKVTG